MAVTIQQLIKWKQTGRSIISLTAWDYSLAEILDLAGVDLILVGDSLAMVGLGYDSTLPVTLDEMIHHAKAVCRGVNRALVVCDLPFMSYQVNLDRAIEAAGRVLKETGASGIKIEGGHPKMLEIVRELTAIGIPVMGHVGLTPQSFRVLGYRQQGKTEKEANLIVDHAVALEQAGAFSIILEHIPQDLAATITDKLAIPTIGIGAGNKCDGQVLVTADFLGLSAKQPPFAKSYVNLRQVITSAVEEFTTEVRDQKFPPA
ncbi:3-methyl-2-oxobutanoate hydroxymethyltransferase [Waterburya agarophytonicola K14]|uniref:3-methyl-2-oxobutanoate hydroxymethyltransferase n=1 Tax=Waterburya agarophytonicola KI4 TaxID=2874699 RepID=A0A964BQL0_9CYAN|nr:3-methyl-2-oxobutanoate hydroxymethyltransferase [Waterburya agarophytonicola]MCC0176663.1 3-methyl-2-oxobutanoate hydroxymethyltransferase [Waterburya agarophytonicola KI4]